MSGQCDALTRGTTATCSYANKVTIYNCRICRQEFLDAVALATDLAERVPELALPAYFLHGIFDYTVGYQLAMGYSEGLKAPRKGFCTFSRSAHSPVFEEPERCGKSCAKTCWPARVASPTAPADEEEPSRNLDPGWRRS